MLVLCLCGRGWPEMANTWEPLENLLSVSDVIEAFEKRYYFVSVSILRSSYFQVFILLVLASIDSP
ncbi:putative Chromo domain-containing protein [Rosa chinensis]|uniref:Putative Chromo domain-containing protein n=1 Tax=Rosa chinensis TaxID=74649 RepID=A0A2P6QZ77_ROSCH|nr:putative Chromo domain-containing protein [Rosa chinensis]